MFDRSTATSHTFLTTTIFSLSVSKTVCSFEVILYSKFWISICFSFSVTKCLAFYEENVSFFSWNPERQAEISKIKISLWLCPKCSNLYFASQKFCSTAVNSQGNQKRTVRKSCFQFNNFVPENKQKNKKFYLPEDKEREVPEEILEQKFYQIEIPVTFQEMTNKFFLISSSFVKSFLNFNKVVVLHDLLNKHYFKGTSA